MRINKYQGLGDQKHAIRRNDNERPSTGKQVKSKLVGEKLKEAKEEKKGSLGNKVETRRCNEAPPHVKKYKKIEIRIKKRNSKGIKQASCASRLSFMHKTNAAIRSSPLASAMSSENRGWRKGEETEGQ